MVGVPQLLNKLPTVSVQMLGKEITPVTVAKDLGVYIDQSLTYSDHIIKTASTCLRKLIALGLKKFDHTSQGIKSLNWLPVNDRLYLNDAVMMFKCVNKLVPDYLIGKFTLRSQVHTRNTRQCGQLNIPRCRTTGQRSFTYRGASRLWNHLRDDVKSSDSVKAFRKRIVNLLFSD